MNSLKFGIICIIVTLTANHLTITSTTDISFARECKDAIFDDNQISIRHGDEIILYNIKHQTCITHDFKGEWKAVLSDEQLSFSEVENKAFNELENVPNGIFATHIIMKPDGKYGDPIKPNDSIMLKLKSKIDQRVKWWGTRRYLYANTNKCEYIQSDGNKRVQFQLVDINQSTDSAPN